MRGPGGRGGDVGGSGFLSLKGQGQELPGMAVGRLLVGPRVGTVAPWAVITGIDPVWGRVRAATQT